jgi:myosin heavy subunit
MITCHRCKAQLEEGSLYCEECGALLKTGGPDGEYLKKLAGINKELADSLAESGGTNAKNSLEIAGLKRELKEQASKNSRETAMLEKEIKEKNGITETYINLMESANKEIKSLTRQRTGIIAAGITALVIAIGAGVSAYNESAALLDTYYAQAASLKQENAALKDQIDSLEDYSEELQLLTTERNNLQGRVGSLTNERNNLQTQVNSLTSRNNSLQRETEELRRLAADIKIVSISIGNTDSSNQIVDNYGTNLYASRIRYLATRITYNSLIEGRETFYIKVINPSGAIRSGSSSPNGYSYNWSINVNKGVNTSYLGGFGSASGGSYSAGTYTVEVWHKNIRLGSASVTLR